MNEEIQELLSELEQDVERLRTLIYRIKADLSQKNYKNINIKVGMDTSSFLAQKIDANLFYLRSLIEKGAELSQS